MAVDITARYIRTKTKEIEVAEEIVKPQKKQNLYFETPSKDIFKKVFLILFSLGYAYKGSTKQDDKAWDQYEDRTFVLGKEDGTLDFGFSGSKFFTDDVLKKPQYRMLELRSYIGQFSIKEEDLIQLERSRLELEYNAILEFERKKEEEIQSLETEKAKFVTYKEAFVRNDRDDLVKVSDINILSIDEHIASVRAKKLKRGGIQTQPVSESAKLVGEVVVGELSISNDLSNENEDIIPEKKVLKVSKVKAKQKKNKIDK